MESQLTFRTMKMIDWFKSYLTIVRILIPPNFLFYFDLKCSKFKACISSTKRRMLSSSLRPTSGATSISTPTSRASGIRRNFYCLENCCNRKVRLPLWLRLNRWFSLLGDRSHSVEQDVGHIALDLSVPTTRKEEPTTPVKLRGSELNANTHQKSNGHVAVFVGDASNSTTTAESTTQSISTSNASNGSHTGQKKPEKDHVAISFWRSNRCIIRFQIPQFHLLLWSILLGFYSNLESFS